MATDDEDLARQQYESSGRKKKRHKKDRDGFGKMRNPAGKDARSNASTVQETEMMRSTILFPAHICSSFPRDYNFSQLCSMETAFLWGLRMHEGSI
jgi:hypothetical protein